MAERFLIMVRSHLPFIFLWNELFMHQLTIHFKMQFFLILKLSSSQLYKKNKPTIEAYTQLDNYTIFSQIFPSRVKGPTHNQTPSVYFPNKKETKMAPKTIQLHLVADHMNWLDKICGLILLSRFNAKNQLDKAI